MKNPSPTRGGAGQLPMSLTVPVEDFCDHLSALRRSPNTIRGYRADLIDLMSHAHSHGDDILGKIGTSQVRAWLADTRVAGASAATMQRRWSAARVFFRWAANEGLISADPTTALNSAKVPKRLPATLGVDQARHILDKAVAQARHDETPHGARDAAILEVLYGGGLRVGELCGLDLGDVDRSRHTVKVTGKGDKERTVPMGAPALRAIDTWLLAVRNGSGHTPGRPSFWESVVVASISASFDESFTPTCVPNQTPPTLGLTGCVTLWRLILWKAEQICAPSRTCWATNPSPPRRSTPTFPPKDCAPRFARLIPAPDHLG